MKEDDVKQALLAIERLIDVKKLWYRIQQQNYFDNIITHNYSSLLPTHLFESNIHNRIWTSFIMVVVHNRVSNVQKYSSLSDLFLDNIPHIYARSAS
ncbi:unnamed protein product [Rotaria sordida]|uniref:Uncharacterized protein n=1 Tax=Rotaria sordida TaxID=392033 RepID=A0A814ZW53_9BILA|nr:unnamed protein product [Rotaria sordida]